MRTPGLVRPGRWFSRSSLAVVDVLHAPNAVVLSVIKDILPTVRRFSLFPVLVRCVVLDYLFFTSFSFEFTCCVFYTLVILTPHIHADRTRIFWLVL